MNKLLTIKQAADMIGVHPETLRRWDQEKKLEAIKINDRGDRRYNRDELEKFLNNNSNSIKYADFEYMGYTIEWNFKGVRTLNASFDKMARLIARKNKNDLIGFIFYISLLSSHQKKKDELERLVLEKIKDIIDTHQPIDGDRFTFDFEHGQFIEIQNPEWWEEKYSKSLVHELRVKAIDASPTSKKNEGWRVILNFISKSGDYWAANSFGKDYEHIEYYVWIDSKELIKRGLPNSSKGAEIIAVEHGVKRFNETKDENGNRNIIRINECNASFYDGRWKKDSLLPDRLMI